MVVCPGPSSYITVANFDKVDLYVMKNGRAVEVKNIPVDIVHI